MAVLNGWINGIYGSEKAKKILSQLNEENGIICNIVAMNGEVGCQFYINHNHYGFSFEFLFKTIGELIENQDKELHGMIYLYNDEDLKFFDTWQVWVVRKGLIVKESDIFLSPYSEKVAIYDEDC